MKLSLILTLILTTQFGWSAKRGEPSSKACENALSPTSPLPKIEPIVLRSLDHFRDHPEWQYEVKYDGFRAVAYFEKDRGCRFLSRNGKRFSQFQSLCEAISQELHIQDAIFDGEIIAIDPEGRPVFKQLLRREGPFQYVAFDLMWFNGEDLRMRPLKERRERLLRVLPKSSRHIVQPLVQVGSGTRLFELVVEYDLEGIVIKRLKDKYLRSTKWYKYKNPTYSQGTNLRFERKLKRTP